MGLLEQHLANCHNYAVSHGIKFGSSDSSKIRELYETFLASGGEDIIDIDVPGKTFEAISKGLMTTYFEARAKGVRDQQDSTLRTVIETGFALR